MQAPLLFKFATVFFITVSVIQARLYHASSGEAVMNTVQILTSYLSALFTSMILYRRFFHPLRQFPGPVLMSLTKIDHLIRSRKLDNFVQLDKLHKTYGDFVRTGPNELTVSRGAALPALLSARSLCTRSPWYDFTKPNTSLVTTRDKTFHDQKRRAWDHAFSLKGIGTLLQCVLYN